MPVWLLAASQVPMLVPQIHCTKPSYKPYFFDCANVVGCGQPCTMYILHEVANAHCFYWKQRCPLAS